MITLQFPRRRAPQAAQPRGAHPYPEDLSVTEALARLDADEAREPSFTPVPGPDPLRQTRPIDGLAAPVQESFTDPRRDMDLLRRVRDGLKGMDAGGRAAEFAADFRGLPEFQKVARSLGWCGLHRDQPPVSFARYTFAGWQQKVMATVDAQVMQFRSDADEHAGRALAEIRMELDGYLRQRAGRTA